MLTFALETDFLIALAMGEENAQGAIDLIMKLRGYPVVTPSVVQELCDQALYQEKDALRNPAQRAFRELTTWGIIRPSLEPKDHAIADIVAQRLVAQRLAPNYHRGLILAEAACLNSRILLTYNREWFSADSAALKVFLVQADLCDCMPLYPHVFNYYIGGSSQSEATPSSPANPS